jgi:hypothetical protein
LKVLEDDTFKKAFKEAQAIASKEARAAELRGEDPSRFMLKDIYDLDEAGNMVTVGKIPDVRTLDYVKRGIDALIDKGYRGEGMSKAEANALKDLKRAYVEVIDQNVPEYAAARAKYAGDIEVLDALRLGRTDYLSPKMLPNEAKKLVDGMSDAERDALRAEVEAAESAALLAAGLVDEVVIYQAPILCGGGTIPALADLVKSLELREITRETFGADLRLRALLGGKA